MSTTVNPLGLRLFLEGIEVPVISGQVTITPDQPSVAAVQIVPSDMALHLLPRTLVHLFYLDDEALFSPTSPPRVDSTGQPENNFNRFDAPDAQYKLLFAGEVIGFNYGKSPDSRQLVLQCMDLSSYWDTCYQWYADYSVGGGALTDKMHVFMGAGKSEFNSVSGGTQWVIGELITTKPKSPEYQNTKGLLGGIIHLLEAIGGLRYKSSGDAGINGCNDFFTIAELRYNLLGMVGAVAKDDTSSKLYSAKAFISWLRNGMTSLGNLVSFRDIINHVDQYIFHHVYPNPCAYLGQGLTLQVQAHATLYSDTGPGRMVKLQVTVAVNNLTEAWGNVVTTPMGTHTIDNVPATYTKTNLALYALGQAFDGMDNVVSDDAVGVKAKIGQAKAAAQSALDTIKQMGYDEATEEQLPGFYETATPESPSESEYRDIETAASQLDGFYRTALDAVGPENGVLSAKAKAQSTSAKTVQTATGAHLYNQLIFPETFFVSPPRCNVLFPDQYFQFSFSRNFMREVTRLSCTAGLGFLAGGKGGPSAALLSTAYYAPNIKDARKTNMYMTMSKGSTVLLPHEIHSGIIPKFEWVSDGQRWAAKASKETGTQDSFYQNGKVGFLQRLANFQFFLHRWSSRSMSVSGIFNPNIVLGLPGVVMDRSLPAPGVVKIIESSLGRRWLPIQYLGKVAYISHSIHQQGGMTQVSYTHCRMHRGFDDEFLGVLLRETELQAHQSATLKFQVKPLLGTFGQTAGFSAEVTGEKKIHQALTEEDLKEILTLYIESSLTPQTYISSPKPFRGAKVLVVTPTGALTVTDEQLKTAGLPDSSSGGTNTLPEILEVKFEFTVGTGKYNRASISIEDALTPSWYSDVWSNANIGEQVYRPLLGIGDITEYVAFTASQQSALLDQAMVDDATGVMNAANQGQPPAGDNPFGLYVDPLGVQDPEFNSHPGSIEEAVDCLTILYGLMKQKGVDINDFIKHYTKRPIANLEEVLGSANLAYDLKGEIDPTIQGNVVEGFHSRAFGDYNADVKYGIREGEKAQAGKDALVGLFPGVTAEAMGTVLRKNLVMKGAKPSSIPAYYDPRGRARARVKTYTQELQVSRGLIG